MLPGPLPTPQVDKIFGPGNQYVTAAKMLLTNSEAMVSIDMPAGPSEVLVIADAAASPVHVAADLLSQVRRGPGCGACPASRLSAAPCSQAGSLVGAGVTQRLHLRSPAQRAAPPPPPSDPPNPALAPRLGGRAGGARPGQPGHPAGPARLRSGRNRGPGQRAVRRAAARRDGAQGARPQLHGPGGQPGGGVQDKQRLRAGALDCERGGRGGVAAGPGQCGWVRWTRAPPPPPPGVCWAQTLPPS